EDLARTPDVTMEQAQHSHTMYAEFEKSQRPYKTALSIWLSRHFGNPRADEYLTVIGENLVANIRSVGEGLSPQYQAAIARAEAVAQEKHFFHWDLEFPEAFIDLRTNTWKSKSAFEIRTTEQR